jgi:hypothetical protein
LILPAACVAVALAAAPASRAAGQKWYEKAVKKVSAEITPAEAKPGQTVTFALTVELNEDYHTYPTKQVDKMAEGMVNTIKFPPAGNLIFVGELVEPKDPKIKADLEIGIMELRYYEGKLTYTRKAVVSPKAAAGPATVKLASFKLSVCDKNNCFPPKTVPVEATMKVLDGPAVEVEKEFAEEVRKALEAK